MVERVEQKSARAGCVLAAAKATRKVFCVSRRSYFTSVREIAAQDT